MGTHRLFEPRTRATAGQPWAHRASDFLQPRTPWATVLAHAIEHAAEACNLASAVLAGQLITTSGKAHEAEQIIRRGSDLQHELESLERDWPATMHEDDAEIARDGRALIQLAIEKCGEAISPAMIALDQWLRGLVSDPAGLTSQNRATVLAYRDVWGDCIGRSEVVDRKLATPEMPHVTEMRKTLAIMDRALA